MFQNVRPLSLSSIYKEARAALEIADIIFNWRRRKMISKQRRKRPIR